MRLSESGHNDKTDAHDARSAAVVAMRHAKLCAVASADHTAVLRLLADGHRQLAKSIALQDDQQPRWVPSLLVRRHEYLPIDLEPA